VHGGHHYMMKFIFLMDFLTKNLCLLHEWGLSRAPDPWTWPWKFKLWKNQVLLHKHKQSSLTKWDPVCAMMENLHHIHQNLANSGYDLEFYNSNATNFQPNWKSSGQTENLDSSFAIECSTNQSELFIDDLIELADESMSTTSTSSAISTPSPMLVPQKPNFEPNFEPNLVRSAPAQGNSTPVSRQPYFSRLHEALTQPRQLTSQLSQQLTSQLTQQQQQQLPVKCHGCGEELTSRCLMQTCADDTKCKSCGRDLTAKCILAVCTVQQQPSNGMQPFNGMQKPSNGMQPPTRRPRVHHYSSPASTSKSTWKFDSELRKKQKIWFKEWCFFCITVFFMISSFDNFDSFRKQANKCYKSKYEILKYQSYPTCLHATSEPRKSQKSVQKV